MDWRKRASTEYPNDLQKQHRIKVALAQLDEGVGTLMGLGIPVHVAEGPPPLPVPDWPKKVFHIRQGERLVACQAELDELGEHWYSTLEEARHAAGMTRQMQRGGIFTKDLPAPLGLIPQAPVQPKDASAPTEGQRLRSEVRRRSNGANLVEMPGTRQTKGLI